MIDSLRSRWPLPALLFLAGCASAPPPPLPLADAAPRCQPLPERGSAPTTISIARDGQLWFTLSAGNAIGRMNPDGSGLVQYPLPTPGSSPRIIAVGADGNLWFSEHNGNRIGRISPAGQIAQFAIPTPASQPRAIAAAGSRSSPASRSRRSLPRSCRTWRRPLRSTTRPSCRSVRGRRRGR